ncbi:MAG: class I SAM-dependent methyltransferase [bacterium]
MDYLTSCPICLSEKIILKSKSQDWLLSKEYFTVMECTDCSFLFTNPRPSADSLPKYYLSTEYISHTDSRKKFTDHLYFLVKRYMFQRKFKLLKPFLSNSDPKSHKILDFGCATGDFVLFLSKKGVKSVGYEPEKNAVLKAKNKGIDVIDHISQLNKEKYKNYFSIITLWHVFEHLPDPSQSVNLLKSLLNDNGIIVMALPNYQSFDAKFYGADWAAWDVPRHLNHFNEKTISFLMKKKGFSLVKKKGMPLDAFYVSLLSEKNLGNKGFWALLKAFFVGLYANFHAVVNQYPYSSQIYIFKKS